MTNDNSAEYASKMTLEHGANPEYYALIKVSGLEDVENLPDDDGMIEGLDNVSEKMVRRICV